MQIIIISWFFIADYLFLCGCVKYGVHIRSVITFEIHDVNFIAMKPDPPLFIRIIGQLSRMYISLHAPPYHVPLSLY